MAVALQVHYSYLLLLLPFSAWLWWKRQGLTHIAIVLGFAVIAALYFITTVQTPQQPTTITTITWTSNYTINGRFIRGFAYAADKKIYATYQLHSAEEKQAYESYSLAGKTFTVDNAKWQEPAPAAHFYAFSMRDYIRNEQAVGIYAITNWQFHSQQSTLVSWLAERRHATYQHIQKYFPKSLQAEASALLLGMRGDTDSEDTRIYQKLGITHLFAISGLHIGLLVALCYALLLRLRITREVVSVSIIIALPLYACFVGGAPSVWRATSLVILLFILRNKRFTLRLDDVLALSYMLFIFIKPSVLWQIGFQLSYLAATALILSQRLLSRISSRLAQSLAITALCQLLVYPVLLYHFFEVSLLAFMANLLFVPLFSMVILPANLLLLALTYITPKVATTLFTIYEPLRSFISFFMQWLQQFPIQMWTPGRPSTLLLVLAFIAIIIFLVCMERRNSRYYVWLILLIPMVVIHFAPRLMSDMVISHINVGQGDSTLIELPHQNKVYLIDTGGVLRFEREKWQQSKALFEVGRQVVVPYLKARGIRHIDALIITHADADHMEGAEEVMQEIAVRELHITPNSWQKPIMQQVLAEAQQQNITIKEKLAGEAWQVGDVDLRYVMPRDTAYEGNDDSLVLFVQQKDFTALFTGDLEAPGEAQLLATQQLPQLTLLKVGHHGSKTSSSEAFLRTVMPKLSIFSTGKNNRYGHPSEEVMARFTDLQLATLNTAEVGTIRIRVGTPLTIATSLYD